MFPYFIYIFFIKFPWNQISDTEKVGNSGHFKLFLYAV